MVGRRICDGPGSDHCRKTVPGASTVPSQPDAIEEIDEVLSRMIKDFKALLYHLKGDQVVDDATFYTTMLSVCPFCGAANEEGMMYSGKMSKWVCLSCGSTV